MIQFVSNQQIQQAATGLLTGDKAESVHDIVFGKFLVDFLFDPLDHLVGMPGFFGDSFDHKRIVVPEKKSQPLFGWPWIRLWEGKNV